MSPAPHRTNENRSRVTRSARPPTPFRDRPRRLWPLHDSDLTALIGPSAVLAIFALVAAAVTLLPTVGTLIVGAASGLVALYALPFVVVRGLVGLTT